MSDLKQDILSLLPGELDYCDVDLMRSVRARLARAQVIEPTDAELRERLQAALPGWEVGDGLSDGTFYIKGPRGFVGYPSQAALRKPGGIEACARALRVLAGVEE